VIHQQRSLAWTDLWKVLGCHPDPAVPVLAPHEAGILVEPMTEEKFALHVHAGTGQGVSLGKNPVHRPTTHPRPVDGASGLVDDPKNLKEEQPTRIAGDELSGPLERAGRQLVVRIKKEQVPATGYLGTPVAGKGPFVVHVVHDDLQVHTVEVSPGNAHRVIGRRIVNHHNLVVGK